MTLAVLRTNSIREFTVRTLLFPKKCSWTSLEMGRITLVVHWTNCIHRFTLITLLLQVICPFNSLRFVK